MSRSPTSRIPITRVLLDENVDARLARFLRAYDFSVAIVAKGATDEQVIEHAIKLRAILLTHDADFADSDRYKPSSQYGIVVLRIHPPLLAQVEDAFRQFMKTFTLSDAYGHILILAEDGYTVIGAST